MNLRQHCFLALMAQSPAEKCRKVSEIYAQRNVYIKPATPPESIKPVVVPGQPSKPELVPPKFVKKRGLNQQTERNYLIHALAHIEFNAINLALDAIYRFDKQPKDYYLDWLFVANDEVRHFLLVCDYLADNGVNYGDFPAHSGLWDICIRTSHNVIDRMALVPRVLEARGLDVSPAMIKKLEHVGDTKAARLINTIYQDEIEHVKIGSKWFKYQCKHKQLDIHTAFTDAIEKHLYGRLRGPFNLEARARAGFTAKEIDNILNKYS